MRHLQIISCLLVAAFGLNGSSASAAFVISFSPSNPSILTAGSSGSVDVLIHSTSPNTLDFFQVDISLTPTGISPVGGLKFAAAQLDEQLTDTSYVFFGKSLSFYTGAPVGFANPAGNVYSGFDATDDGTNAPLAGNPAQVILTGTDLLLIRLNLDAIAAGQYSIDIAPSSAFINDQFDSVAYSSSAGFLTVFGPAAVPEPGSLCLWAVGTFLSGIWLRRGRSVKQ